MSNFTHNVNVFIITKKGSPYLNTITSMFIDKNNFSASSSQRTICKSINYIYTDDNYDVNLDMDYSLVRKAITLANKEDPNSYTIVCKDTATTVASPETIYNTIEVAIETSPFDIFYLANWLDNCVAYTNVKDVDGGKIKIVNTESPNGILTLMFSPSGKQKYLTIFSDGIMKENPTNRKTLGHYIQQNIDNLNNDDNKFNVITSNPRIFNFNLDARGNNDELKKLIACKSANPPPQPKNDNVVPLEAQGENKTDNDTGSMIFWIIISIIIVIVIISVGYMIYKKNYPSYSVITNYK